MHISVMDAAERGTESDSEYVPGALPHIEFSAGSCGPRGRARSNTSCTTTCIAVCANAKGNEVAASVGPEDNTKLLNDLYDKAMARRHALYERGELLGEAQMCVRLAINQAELRKAVREGRLFYIDGGHGEEWYPAFFAGSAAKRHDIERVTLALNPLPGDVKWMFFSTPKYSLDGKTPVEALGDGAVASVLRTALEFAEHNRGVETSHTTSSDEVRHA